MTTNNTDKEEKTNLNPPTNKKDVKETSLAIVEMGNGLENSQCLIKRRPNSSLDGSSTKTLETRMKQMQKHVSRMSMSKLKKEYDIKIIEARPGSGLIWQNQLTIPISPNLTGLSKTKTKFKRSKS